MTTPADLHATVVTILEGLPTITTYDGDVPSAPPCDVDGRVFPYAVVWPSPGGDPSDRALDGVESGLAWMVQVTVAAGTPTWCLHAVSLVRGALTNVRLAPEVSPLRDLTPASRPLMRDGTVTPPRWYTPLLWVCSYPT